MSGARAGKGDARVPAEAEFLRAHPGYAETSVIDDLRRSDFERLDRGGHVYLDYTGGGLYADRQVLEHMTRLRRNVFGNPHSTNPTSASSTALIDSARRRVLDFFGAARCR